MPNSVVFPLFSSDWVVPPPFLPDLRIGGIRLPFLSFQLPRERTVRKTQKNGSS
jgi:hypothetical protein